MTKKNAKMIAWVLATSLMLSACGSPSQDEGKHKKTVNPKVESVVEETTEVVEDIDKADEKEPEMEVKEEEKTNEEQEKPTQTPTPEEIPEETSVSEEVKAEQVPEETPAPQPTPDETTTTQTSTVAVAGTYHYEEAKKTLQMVNDYRAQNGLSALTWSDSLEQAAKTRAAEASICWAHTRPNGDPWYTVSTVVKGENLAKGYATAEEAFNAWLASDTHRENILWGDFATMYVAYFEAENGWFWAQEFGY